MSLKMYYLIPFMYVKYLTCVLPLGKMQNILQSLTEWFLCLFLHRHFLFDLMHSPNTRQISNHPLEILIITICVEAQ